MFPDAASSNPRDGDAASPADVASAVCLADFEPLAAGRLERGPLAYYAGGAGDEHTLRDNVAAWGRWALRPRMLVDVSETTTATEVLGTPVAMPVLVAPTALHRMCHPDGEQATARAAAAAGTIMCVSSIATATPGDVAAAAPGAPRWFQVYVYRDRGVTRSFVDQAVEAGYEALVLTVDVPRPGRRERDLRAGFRIPEGIVVPSFAAALGHEAPATIFEIFGMLDQTLTWHDLEELATSSDLPVLVKGVLTEEDARLAVEHGAAGVVVSNHGGRQLDGVLAGVDALPEVVDAVEGRATVLVDGGVRRGVDVARALALGAQAVMIGRPILWGLAAGGEAGVARVLELLRDEVELALALCGAPSPSRMTRAHVTRAPAHS